MSGLNPAIFKAYDVRGLYGSDIDSEVAGLIGRAFARVIAELEDKPTSELRLGLGRDMRLTAPEIAASYRDGICSEGAKVLDIGQVGTEMLYYLVGSRSWTGADVYGLAQSGGTTPGRNWSSGGRSRSQAMPGSATYARRSMPAWVIRPVAVP